MVKGADDVPGLVLDKSCRHTKYIFFLLILLSFKREKMGSACCVHVGVSSAYNQLQAAALVAWKDQQLLLQAGA